MGVAMQECKPNHVVIPGRKPKWDDEVVARAIEMRRGSDDVAPKSYKEIGRKLDVPWTTIREWLRDLCRNHRRR